MSDTSSSLARSRALRAARAAISGAGSSSATATDTMPVVVTSASSHCPAATASAAGVRGGSQAAHPAIRMSGAGTASVIRRPPPRECGRRVRR
ncbi:hypothetical protein STENM327S_02125 [Streptomyces tendae]